MKSESSFTGQLGFILTAAGSAVGVGNLWRFPYLAAKDGGGLFLIVYLILALTFGYTLLSSDIAIGRRTQKSSILAYTEMNPKWKFLGVLTFLVPVIIMTYYAVIGGWITRYAAAFLGGEALKTADAHYFTDFISSPWIAAAFALLFMAVTAFIVYMGVESGIEKVSKFMMPILLIMVIGIAVFSLTLRHEDADGRIRTGLQGLLIYLTPDLTGLTVKRFLQILLDAMSQLFFSLSVSMGIMITYGSYVKKDVNLNHAVTMIEGFDTLVAFLAGIMIIPAVYVFQGTEGMGAGPSLMFISLPQVFASMGKAGAAVGAAFFIMTVFATLTSCISVLETIVANCMIIFRSGRKKTTLALTLVYLAASAVIALGYSVFYVEIKLPNGSVGQLLDLMDYISNSVMMPFIAFLSCILIGWIVKPLYVTEEMEYGGAVMRKKGLYSAMVKYAAPVLMLILFIQSTGILN
ncbi:sodium-dependent transporter [Lachnoclostridium sp. Marseille-P6806]|uniref:sodium-dependent transporter n=1 Tax=Lachnoclostridium sp. Marseille-P6806 TaxID=2364793 RepID=UPI0010300143|nr:sodium-dependent transporter [Lachnoclostridium sp. Marseille-P6806]